MENCSENIHPLLIREITSTLFEYLTRNELIEARLVCSQWRSVGWVELTKRVQICFRTAPALECYTNFFKSSDRLSPFTSYKFCYQYPPNSTQLTDFFTNFGSKILKLDLQYANFIFTTDLQRLVSVLKYLSISSSRIELESSSSTDKGNDNQSTLKSLHSLEIFVEVTSVVFNIIEEFLRSQLSLQSFKINAGLISETFSDQVINTITTSKAMKSSSFEKLEINFPIRVMNLFNLARSKLRLKSVSLKIQNQNRESSVTESLYKFLESQKTSLVRFHCRFFRWWGPEPEFGRMPVVKFLEEIHLEFIVGDLQFLSNCQSLRRVNILSWRPEFGQINSESFSTMPSVESACISLSGFPVVYIVLDYVTRFFPGLRIFEFNASVDDTRMYSQLIRDRLPQLTERSVERLKIF